MTAFHRKHHQIIPKTSSDPDKRAVELSHISNTMLKVAMNAAVKYKIAATLKNATTYQKTFCKSFSVIQDAFTAPLPFKVLPFDSVELDAETLPVQDTSEFGSRLYSTLDKCRTDGIKSIFLRVPMLYSHYIPVAG
jgi:hypothetical protein